MKYEELEAGGIKIIDKESNLEQFSDRIAKIRQFKSTCITCGGVHESREDGLCKYYLEEPDSTSIQVGGDHYKKMKIQPIDFIMANELDYCQANVIKYVCRYEDKNGVEDLDKAMHYLQLLKEIKYE